MFIYTRKGEKVEVRFDKITARNAELSKGLDIDHAALSKDVIANLKSGMKTDAIDQLSCETAIAKSTYSPDYGILASRIFCSNLHKSTSDSFAETLKALQANVNKITNKANPLLDDKFVEWCLQNIDRIDKEINYKRDFDFSFFSFKALEKAYLMKTGGTNYAKVVERPQHMFMRVAMFIHGPRQEQKIYNEKGEYVETLPHIPGDIDKAIETYHQMSTQHMTHATPTLFNAGTKTAQMSSCFLLNFPDELEGIFQGIKHCALISKQSGGIGVSLQLRGNGSYIQSTNGISQGIIPMIKVLNEVARYVDQCFLPDTYIYTPDGPKQMQDIHVGDQVLTNDGSFQMVLNVKKDQTGESLFGVQTNANESTVWTTAKHPLMTVRKDSWDTITDLVTNLNSKKVVPQFVEAELLKIGDFIGYPIPTYEKDISSLTTDVCRFHGIYVNSGKYDASTHKCTVNYSKQATMEFLQSFLTNHNTKVEFVENHSTIKYTQNFMIPTPSAGFIHKCMIHLPTEKLTAFLSGILESTAELDEENDIYTLKDCDPLLKHCVQYMLLRLRLLPSFTEAGDMNVSLKNHTCEAFCFENTLYTKITAFATKDYSGCLYDLNVENNQNYCTQLGLAHNGGGKRKGSISVYLQPFHPDIMEFLELRLNTGTEEFRARDIFTALWIPDIFFKRVQAEEAWSLIDPSVCPELLDLYGEEFEKAYIQAEKDKKYTKQIPAQEVWKKIMTSLAETGLPYMLSKDSVNKKSNQANIGPIRGSNLCVSGDTMLLTDKGEQKISELAGQTVNVWNGEEFSKSTVMQTGVNQDMMTVQFSNSKKICCTLYHKFFVKTSEDTTDMIKVVEACNLKIGDKLKSYQLPNKSCHEITIIGTHLNDTTATTYCFNEPKLNQGILNGILTGNCAEIVEYHSPDSVAVCNLSSIALGKFVLNKKFDYTKLMKTVKIAVTNLNNVIDRNWYPTHGARLNNQMYRPIAVGVQALADVFALMEIAWESEEAKMVNKCIFETMYFAALEQSCELAKTTGAYQYFKGSPASKGLLQYDLWNVHPITDKKQNKKDKKGSKITNSNITIPSHDWTGLKDKIKKYGLKNSLLLALMPTVTTSQIFNNSESFEPYTSNLFVRKTSSGEFIVSNPHLYKTMKKLDLWNSDLVDEIRKTNGSIQNVDTIPADVKKLFKTVWEIPQKTIIDLAADRGAFVDQTSSMNIHLKQPTVARLTSMYFHAWKLGLKTLSYYVRSAPAVDAVKLEIKKDENTTIKKRKIDDIYANSASTIQGFDVEDDPNVCTSCQ